MERIEPADFFDRPAWVRAQVRWSQPHPCDVCEQASAGACPECGLLLCADCRDTDEHREYCAAVQADREDDDR